MRETPPPVAADTVITDMIGVYMDEQAEDLSRLEGSRTERIGDGIRVTWESGVVFDFDSAMLKTDFTETLDELAEVFARYPDTDIIIARHTDGEGSETFSEKLSERRAMSLRDCLVDRGVAPSRITYGPISPDGGDDATPVNSRVEIQIRANEALRARVTEG